MSCPRSLEAEAKQREGARATRQKIEYSREAAGNGKVGKRGNGEEGEAGQGGGGWSQESKPS